MKINLLDFIKLTHKWLGLVVGWFLFFIFLSGSISIFDREIDLWMQPKLYAFLPPKFVTLQAFKQSYQQWTLIRNYPRNIIILPYDRNPIIRVMHYQDKILQGNAIDPIKGTLIKLRQTGGGYFIDTLHKNFFLGPALGKPIMLCVDIIFILILVTGLLVYLFLFSKTFLFINRNRKKPVFQRDLHTVLSIFTYPFSIIISLSALLFFIPVFFSHKPIFNHNPYPHTTISNPVTPLDLKKMSDKASIYFSRSPELIKITQKTIIFYARGKNSLSHSMNFIAFDKYNQNKISVRPGSNFIHRIDQQLKGVHLLHCENNLLRIVAFPLGMGCTILTAMGLLFFSNKQKERLGAETKNKLFLPYRIMDGITLGIIMGSLHAFIIYFWMNRILSDHLGNRLDLEIESFFTVLLVILCIGIGSAFGNYIHLAWRKLMFSFSCLCLTLPLFEIAINLNTAEIAFTNGYYSYFAINSFIFIIGCIFLQLHRILSKE
ncbi:hypothetical protein COMNV_01231 [Commensalibacter sp. Nvir]|uniref:PepSY-associated TM helix domain-containing protein n=1 Tax=Commensalibacter sp. Nvir TaxID=3069817 RepID=UPI002D730D30|nr:hypothetical protein COMNV_01231 [Commensalibacter sp. Nvir]